MRKYVYLLGLILLFVLTSQAQKISTFQYVEILDDNREETLFYFQKNWLHLRKLAIENDIIDSYQLHETEFTPETPFHLILVTTYSSIEQYEKREKGFGRIMEGRELNLLNDKQPGEFRKTVFVNEAAKQLE